MKEAKTERVSTKVSKRVKDLISNSDYSFTYAIEYFADTVIGNKQKDAVELHLIQKEIKELQDKEFELIGKEVELKEKIGYSNKEGIEISPKAEKAVQVTLNYYERKGVVFGSVEKFLDNAEKGDANFIESQAYLSDLDLDEFKKLVVMEYEDLKI